MNKIFKQKKGQVALYVSTAFIVIIIVLIAAVAAPMGATFSSRLYLEGQEIIANTNDTIQNITDTAVRDQLTSSLNSAMDSGQTNIDVSYNFFQYSWIFVIGIVALIAFLTARRLVEFGGFGGFV